MKRKFNSMWRVAITLVMVLSLSLVAAVPVSALVPGAALTVTITQPAAGSEIATGDDIVVIANVENTGDVKATDVEATIAIITGDATITGEATKTVTPAVLPVGETGEITWTLTAGAEGPVTIEVTSAGKDFITGAAIPAENLFSDTVDIQQVELIPFLTAYIIVPATGSSVTVDDAVAVTVVVVNTGHAEATTVVATMAITAGTAAITTGNTPQTVDGGTLAVGGSAEMAAVWEVTSTALGPVTIEVTLTGQYGTSPVSIPGDNLVSGSIALTPQLAAALKVTAITAPANAKVGEEFDITATVKNTGEATATAVEATVYPGKTLPVASENIGTGNGSLVEFTDTLEKAPVVSGTLVITPSANIDTIETDYETGDITVTYSVAPGAVEIVVEYIGWQAGTLVSVVDAAVDLVDLAGGAETQVTFTMLSLDVGDAFIKVELTAGDDANTGSSIGDLQPNSAIVIQKEAAVLKVTALTDNVAGATTAIGEEFVITATVENTGMATAQGVALTLSIDANAALKVQVPAQSLVKSIGYLGPGDTVSSVTWTLVSTAAGKSTITVTPSGTDVLTLTAIPAGSLIPKDVIVLQAITTSPISLEVGWNLISLPLIPTPTESSIETVLAGAHADVTVNKVTYYTGGTAGDWQLYTPGFGDLTQMNAGKGYWIDVSSTGALDLIAYGVDLALPGDAPPTYDVVVGWNLIGFTSTDVSTDASTYLGPAVIQTVEAMYRYDASLGVYTAVAITNLVPGEGYWLAVNAAGKIYP